VGSTETVRAATLPTIVVALVSLFCAFGLQQLSVQPFPAETGQPVRILATRAGAAAAEPQPLPGLPLEVEWPDGTRHSAGVTGADGAATFTPEHPGAFVYRTQVDGVALVAPHRVVAKRRPWLLALACAPLGLVLLWRQLRPRPPR
jgi:hypothetical protein